MSHPHHASPPAAPQQRRIPTWAKVLIALAVTGVVAVVGLILVAVVIIDNALDGFEDIDVHVSAAQETMLTDAMMMAGFQDATIAMGGEPARIAVGPGVSLEQNGIPFTASEDNTVKVTTLGQDYCIRVTNPNEPGALYYDSADPDPLSNQPGGACKRRDQ